MRAKGMAWAIRPLASELGATAAKRRAEYLMDLAAFADHRLDLTKRSAHCPAASDAGATDIAAARMLPTR